MRQNVGSRSAWEEVVGYSRAVWQVGHHLSLTGTTATMNGEVVPAGDPAGQTRVILNTTEEALSEAVANFCDVVRTCVNVMV